ncbi:sodium-coupled monocarboxylate transporter 1 [Anopheles nili]|uniref:sodium-coupled monocarboxylate transporter 1 n=1 Tax=Anopheles nili TaxID=185578 RepID=UPI00237ABC81|nr:sodium-coupled monocarboxylate transporter 1 [Anopheles nili]
MSGVSAQWWSLVVILLVGVSVVSVVESATIGALAGRDSESDESRQQSEEETITGKASFTAYDYVAVGVMLVISIGIGVFYGFFEKKSGTDGSDSGSSDDFLLGSGMSLFPVTLSLTTSFITAIELLGNPSEMFFNGTQFSLIVISMALVVPVAVKVFYPIYFKLEVTSCYEYLGMRFDKRIRVFGAVLYVLQMLFYTSVAVLAPAIALSEATGLNRYIAVVLIYFVCIFYSSQGGMKAVVIADTFQACVLLLSLVLILALGTHYSAGLSDVFSRASDHGRIEFFNFDPDPTTRHSVFSVIIGGFFYWTSMFCTNQASVQKCMSLKSLQTAKLALYFSLLGLIAVFLMNFYTGLMTFAHYSDCDPLAAGQITAKDQLLPFYVMDVFGHIKFMAGIFVAGIFAASLGTVAAALNSLAAVTCEDLLVSGMKMKIPDGKGALYAKWMSLGFGLVSFGLVFIVERLGGILQATLTLNGLIGGVTLGLFSLGIFFRRANGKGAMLGGIIALVLVVVIGVLAQVNNEEPPPLSSSVDGCNATAAWDRQDFAYETEPSGGEGLFMALQHHPDQDGALGSVLTIALQKSWNGEELDNNFYRLSGEDGSPESSPSRRDVVKTSFRQTDSPDDSSSWFAPVYRISYMWYSCLGTVLTMLFGIIISFLTEEDSFARGLCCGEPATESELPCPNTNQRMGTQGSEKSIPPTDEKQPKLSVASMAPLALMMRTSVKLSPSGGKSQKVSPNEASIGSSMSSVFSLDQVTLSSELGLYTDQEMDRREPLPQVTGSEPTAPESEAMANNGTSHLALPSLRVERERF